MGLNLRYSPLEWIGEEKAFVINPIGGERQAFKLATAIEISASSMTDAILISGTTPVDGIHISSSCSAAGINLSGANATGIDFNGEYSTHAINFDDVTLSTTLIGAGSYSSPMDQSTTTGLINFASTSDDDAFRIGVGLYMKGTGSGTKIFPLCVQAEYNGTGGTDRIEAAQLITFFGAGGEAARLKTLGGDGTAGGYSLWTKVTSNTNCVFDSGCRVAPIWVDNQINAVVNGEEYGIFFTCGGSKVDAAMAFETTSSGWSNFLYFDETAYDQDPVSSSGCNVSGAGASEAYLKVNLNGTAYGIPLIAI